jgi:homoserine O-acetyltransferase/O-succinyltransferase
MNTTNTATLYTAETPFRFENGATVGPLQVAWQTYGTLNAEGTNAILICHALTGNAHAAGISLSDDVSYTGENRGHAANNSHGPKEMHGWWDGVIGDGKAFDTSRYFVVCANFLGSCYGTTGPVSIDPETGRRYGMRFPRVTVRDMVHVQYALLKQLGVNKLATISGGSLGGMQVLEWPLLYPDFVQSIIPIATAAAHSAWAIGLNEAARLAIMNDPAWKNGEYAEQPLRGLALARMIAMISYRSQVSFGRKFGRGAAGADVKGVQEDFGRKDPLYQVESYLRYQGRKLVERFDANTYVYITHAMDSHDVSRDRGTMEDVLGSIDVPTLCLGVDSDVLYPVNEQKDLASMIPGAAYAEIQSIHGHDAFLIEFDQLNAFIPSFLAEAKIQ